MVIMNWWGFTVTSNNGRVIFHDFGYETEEEAQSFGKKFINEWAEDATISVSQRWCEVDDDPNDFVDD